jgi:phosphoglycerate dehydrogenase-like enzyme
MPTILISLEQDEISDANLARVQQLAPEANIVVTKDPHQIEEVAEDVEIAAGWPQLEVLLSLPNLRWFQQWWAGNDWLMKYPQAVDKDFVITNASGVHATCISEQIFAYLLAFARALPAARKAQDKKEWKEATREMVFELAHQTMVIVGLGDIGLRTARLALAFEMRVISVDRNSLAFLPGVEKVVGPAHLGDVLPEADFVVVTLPHTKETEGIIGQAEFERMKPGAYFVNIGRGKTVNETALIEALRSGKIAGAGLDVFETEPLPTDSPLWEMENVIITAHYAGATPVYQNRTMAIFLENLRRYRAGETLHNVVDKRLGY